MKILGICGSPRKGNSERMLHYILESARENSAECDLLCLREKNVALCDGTQDQSIDKSGDEMSEIQPLLEDADVILMASPIYYDMISPQLFNFIVRLNPFSAQLKGKGLAFVLSGQLKGEEAQESMGRAADYLRQVAEIYELDFVGSVLAGGLAGEGDVQKREEVIDECRALGQKLCSV